MNEITAVTGQKRRRHAFSDSERQHLRQYYREHPDLSYDKLIQWFYSEYNRQLSRSTVSETLSDKYAFVDNIKIKKGQAGTKRHQPATYPQLEEALYDIQQLLQHRKESISGQLLKDLAHRLWYRLPELRELLEPAWSNGWLEGFQKRKGLRSRRQHGKASSVPEIAIHQMDEIR